MSTEKESGRVTTPAASTMQTCNEENYRRRWPRKFNGWLSDSRQYRRSSLLQRNWIEQEGLDL